MRLRAKDLGVLLMVTSLTSTLHWAKEVVVEMWDKYGLVNHDVIDLASQRVIIGKRTTNGGISFRVIPFDNNSWSKSRKIKASRPKTHVSVSESSSRIVSSVRSFIL